MLLTLQLFKSPRPFIDLDRSSYNPALADRACPQRWVCLAPLSIVWGEGSQLKGLACHPCVSVRGGDGSGEREVDQVYRRASQCWSWPQLHADSWEKGEVSERSQETQDGEVLETLRNWQVRGLTMCGRSGIHLYLSGALNDLWQNYDFFIGLKFVFITYCSWKGHFHRNTKLWYYLCCTQSIGGSFQL